VTHSVTDSVTHSVTDSVTHSVTDSTTHSTHSAQVNWLQLHWNSYERLRKQILGNSTKWNIYHPNLHSMQWCLTHTNSLWLTLMSTQIG